MEYRIRTLPTSTNNPAPVIIQHYCPECGYAMKEIERLKETGGMYVWYECLRDGCDGSWFEKHPLPGPSKG